MSSQTTALHVAKYFLWRADQEGKKITNKKLQKLLYYAQAWHIVFENKPLFKDSIEAWIHGPAIAAVYDKYKKFGHGPIDEDVEKTEIKDILNIKVLKEVWDLYGKFDANYLEVLTHNELPWQQAREKLDTNTPSNAVISVDAMRAFYTSLLDKYSDK